MEIARDALPGAPAARRPAGAYVLIELAAPGPVDLAALLTGFLEQAMAAGLVTDGIVAASEAQAARIWALRESVNEGQARRGRFLRQRRLGAALGPARLRHRTCAAIEAAVPGALPVAYGHFGDGNVHLNVLPPAASTRRHRRPPSPAPRRC